MEKIEIKGTLVKISEEYMKHGSRWQRKKPEAKGTSLEIKTQKETQTVNFPNTLSITFNDQNENPILNQEVMYTLSKEFKIISEAVGDDYTSCKYCLRILSGPLKGFAFNEEYWDMD